VSEGIIGKRGKQGAKKKFQMKKKGMGHYDRVTDTGTFFEGGKKTTFLGPWCKSRTRDTGMRYRGKTQEREGKKGESGQVAVWTGSEKRSRTHCKSVKFSIKEESRKCVEGGKEKNGVFQSSESLGKREGWGEKKTDW